MATGEEEINDIIEKDFKRLEETYWQEQEPKATILPQGTSFREDNRDGEEDNDSQDEEDDEDQDDEKDNDEHSDNDDNEYEAEEPRAKSLEKKSESQVEPAAIFSSAALVDWIKNQESGGKTVIFQNWNVQDGAVEASIEDEDISVLFTDGKGFRREQGPIKTFRYYVYAERPSVAIRLSIRNKVTAWLPVLRECAKMRATATRPPVNQAAPAAPATNYRNDGESGENDGILGTPESVHRRAPNQENVTPPTGVRHETPNKRGRGDEPADDAAGPSRSRPRTRGGEFGGGGLGDVDHGNDGSEFDGDSDSRGDNNDVSGRQVPSDPDRKRLDEIVKDLNHVFDRNSQVIRALEAENERL